MKTIQGKHNQAICYAADIEEAAEKQIQTVCDMPEFADATIRIMPDVHVGKGCTIGTTMTLHDKVVPAMVGVDIGCGMETIELAERAIDFQALDDFIRASIPSGREIRKQSVSIKNKLTLSELRCLREVDLHRAKRAVGTLGGGNHFIEVDRAEDGRLFLIIHSGSRHLGLEVAEYYQKQAYRALWGGADFQLRETIARLRAEHRESEIQRTIVALKKDRELALPKELAWVSGTLFDDYIHDMKMTQYYAVLNRGAIADDIIAALHLTVNDRFTTVHNYIDLDAMILRKGAVSAKAGEKLVIPINMAAGTLLCTGKGNPDWNCSAPHGAGRRLSRTIAAQTLSMEEYRRDMEGIWSTSICEKTIDESPAAYKRLEDIVDHIGPTVDVATHLRPVYNFKSPY